MHLQIDPSLSSNAGIYVTHLSCFTKRKEFVAIGLSNSYTSESQQLRPPLVPTLVQSQSLHYCSLVKRFGWRYVADITLAYIA